MAELCALPCAVTQCQVVGISPALLTAKRTHHYSLVLLLDLAMTTKSPRADSSGWTQEICKYRATAHAQTSLNWVTSVSSRHDATRICCWAPTPAERRLQLLIDICCRRLCLAANQPAAVATVYRWDRQTLTSVRYNDPALNAIWAASVNN